MFSSSSKLEWNETWRCRNDCTVPLCKEGEFAPFCSKFKLIWFHLKNSSLTALLLKDNGLKDEGIFALAEAIRNHPSLLHLGVQENKFEAGSSCLLCISKERDDCSWSRGSDDRTSTFSRHHLSLSNHRKCNCILSV